MPGEWLAMFRALSHSSTQSQPTISPKSPKSELDDGTAGLPGHFRTNFGDAASPKIPPKSPHGDKAKILRNFGDSGLTKNTPLESEAFPSANESQGDFGSFGDCGVSDFEGKIENAAEANARDAEPRPTDWCDLYAARSAIREFDGGYSRADAEGL